MADNAVKFDRKPYTVTYKDLSGETKTIRRVPPPKLHDTLPTDIVRLKHKKSDDFEAGEDFEVAGITARQPNTLHLVNESGAKTFVDFYDTNLERKVAPRDGVDPKDLPANNKYLRWP